MGFYTCPILMAADILLMRADLVPVGKDQTHHVEIARDIAATFNQNYRWPAFKEPRAVIEHSVHTVVGLDARKMSKSYDNVLPLFEEPSRMRKLVARIKTDSRTPDEPKDPDASFVQSVSFWRISRCACGSRRPGGYRGPSV